MKKRMVITGASKGIGKALAVKFAAEGFDLALCSRTLTDLERLKTEIAHEGIEIKIFTCDVSKKEEVKKFSDDVLRDWSSVNIVVNNAGTFEPGQAYNEAEGTLERLIATNLYSAYYTSRNFIPGMIMKKSGHIFNVCSVASIQAYHNDGSYSISKFAMLGLSKAFREELKEFNIRVTSLIPGATYTDSWSKSGLPEARFMKVEDIAKVVYDIYHLSENTVVEEIVLRPMQGDI